MIIFSEERYVPSIVNAVTLQCNEGYILMGRDVYDAAVILQDRYDLISLSDEVAEVYRRTNNEVIEWFYDNAPKPLNALAPYLGLVDEGLSVDMEECCGVLHVLSAFMDLRKFVKVPKEIRKEVGFSLSIMEEYDMAWERMLATCIPYDEFIEGIRPPKLSANSYEYEEEDTEDELTQEEIDARMLAELEAEFANLGSVEDAIAEAKSKGKEDKQEVEEEEEQVVDDEKQSVQDLLRIE